MQSLHPATMQQFFVYPQTGNFPQSPLQHQRLRLATSRWTIAFALEGLSLDRCVSLDCEIRDELDELIETKSYLKTASKGSCVPK